MDCSEECKAHEAVAETLQTHKETLREHTGAIDARLKSKMFLTLLGIFFTIVMTVVATSYGITTKDVEENKKNHLDHLKQTQQLRKDLNKQYHDLQQSINEMNIS